MSEKLEKIKGKTGGMFAWMGKHKVISTVIVIMAISMVYNNVIAKVPLSAQASTSTSVDAGATAQNVPAQTAKAFMAEYGTYSYVDALDTKELAKTAHKDLVAAIVNERISENMLPGEAPDTALAQARMAETGLVKVTSPLHLTLSLQDDGTYQITVEVEENVFTADKGITKTTATYLVELKKSAEAGVGSPYQVTRVFKQA